MYYYRCWVNGDGGYSVWDVVRGRAQNGSQFDKMRLTVTYIVFTVFMLTLFTTGKFNVMTEIKVYFDHDMLRYKNINIMSWDLAWQKIKNKNITNGVV